jgi:hypothetical protein
MHSGIRLSLALCVLVAATTSAHADPCTGITASGGKFATCFDPGNRLSLTAGSDGFGGSIALRHIIHFDDEPDLIWKLEHVLFDATHAGFTDTFDGTLYRGRFVRHARDGHIVIPLGVPKKVFLPFDIGAFTEVGRIRWRDAMPARINLVEVAGVIDFARSRAFRRIAFGPVARWEVDVTREGSFDLGQHLVAPFSMGIANLHYESTSGRLVGDLRVEAGTVWRSMSGWQPEANAEATLERVMLAINDRPIALVLGARYESETGEAIARIGARIVLFDRRDPRVSRLD